MCLLAGVGEERIEEERDGEVEEGETEGGGADEGGREETCAGMTELIEKEEGREGGEVEDRRLSALLRDLRRASGKRE